MYSALYVLTSLAFVASVAAYAYFCVGLSKDIKNGQIPVRLETDSKK